MGLGWRWLPVAAQVLCACAGGRAVGTPLVDHAPSSHRGLRLYLPPPELSGEAAQEAADMGLTGSLQSALASTLAGIGYQIVRDPHLEQDLTLQIRAEIHGAGGPRNVRASLAMSVIGPEGIVDVVRYENRDASGWYAARRPFAEHASVMLVNALERSGSFIEAARSAAERRQAGHRVLVLEFRGPGDPGFLASLADAARTAAVDPARRRGFTVMTAEDVAAGLRGPGAACFDDDCALQLSRRLGAELLVTGEVSELDDRLVASLALHDTRTGRLVGATRTTPASQTKLMEVVRPAVWSLFDHE